MAELPAQVERLRKRLRTHRAEFHKEFGEAACKLLDDNPELVRLWRSIERRSREEDPYVSIFLSMVQEAAELPRYHYLAASERRQLVRRIEDAASDLSSLIQSNDLDFHLIHMSGLNFNGFYIYEDFGDSNRARIDADGIRKLVASQVIAWTASRSAEKIKSEPIRGKAGRQVRQVRFIRRLAARIQGYYRKPLPTVVATAANTVYGTNYSPGDIQNLLSR